MKKLLKDHRSLVVTALITILVIIGLNIPNWDQILSGFGTLKGGLINSGKDHDPPPIFQIAVADVLPTATPKPGTSTGPSPSQPSIPKPEPTATPEPPTPTPIPEVREVDVIAPEGKQGQLGKTIYYTFNVINRGNIEDRYRLILTADLDLPTGQIPDEITLAPEASINISTYIELPLAGEYSTYNLTLTAISQTDNSVHDEDSVITRLKAPEPKLEFTKSVDKTVVVPGEQLIYTFRYKNTGNIPLLNVKIEDKLPKQVQFEASSIAVEIIDEGTLQFELHPVLYQGQQGSFSITVRVKDDASPRGQVSNTAILSAKGLLEPVTANARLAIEVPDLTIEKSVNRSDAKIGDILLYTITITNNGSGTARSAKILDTLPSVMRYVPGTSVINGTIVNDPEFQGTQAIWEIGELKAGDQLTLRYQTTVTARTKSGVYRNKAIVQAEDIRGRTVHAGPAKTKVIISKTGRKLLAEVEGIVFEDMDGSGDHDSDEPGLQGIEVLLLRDLVRQFSDEDGEFFFGDLEPGEQAVSLDSNKLPPGYHLTTESTLLVSLTEGDRGFVEFGVQSDLAEIVGVVYYDANRNGQRDPGEPGVEGVQIEIDDTVVFTTDAQGTVVATHFPPGTHTIVLNEESLPDQYRLSDFLGTPGVSEVTLSPGDSQTVEFGLVLQPGRILGMVFEDANENGVFNPGEAGIPELSIELQNGTIFRTKTDDLGDYVFGGLEPGAYTATLLPESLPANYRPTSDLAQSVIVLPGQEETLLWGIAPVVIGEPVKPSPPETPEFILPIPAPTATPAPVEEEDYCVYTIRSGDTLSRIASRLTGSSKNYRQIMKFNTLTSEIIREGDHLNIPKTLLLEEYQTCEFEPPEWTRLAGRVFFDKNKNAQYDEEEPLLEQFHAVFARKLKTRGKDGTFIFSHIESGEHEIEILYGEKTYSKTVTLQPGQNEHDFPLRYTGIKIIVSQKN